MRVHKSWRDDEGAFAILFALVIVAIVGMAALVVDQSALRFDRRGDKAATDAGALAGVNGLIGTKGVVGTPQAACIAAFHYVWTDLAVNPEPGNNCSTFPTTVEPCPATAQIATSSTALGTGLSYTVRVFWPVPDRSRLMTTPDLEKWENRQVQQGQTATDGNACDRIGVTVDKTRPAAFSGIYNQHGATTESASVAVFKPGEGHGTGVIPLVVLDPHQCNALDASGGASNGGIWVLDGINSQGEAIPGMIGVNSDGTVNCNGQKTVINTSSGANSNVHIWAYDSTAGAPAHIFSFAVQTGGPAYNPTDTDTCVHPNPPYDSSTFPVPPPPSLNDHLCTTPEFSDPVPDPALNRQPYIDALDRWVPSSPPTSDPSWLVLQSKTDCKTAPALLAANPGLNVYVDCSLTVVNGETVAFPGAGFVVIAKDVQVNNGGTLCFNGVAGVCKPSSLTSAQPVVLRGALNVPSQATLIAPRTFILQSDSATPAGGTPDDNVTTQLSANGIVDWTAPVPLPANDVNACPTDSVPVTPNIDCFARLAYWSDYDSDPPANKNAGGQDSLNGQSAIQLEGVWHIPNSEFDFAGGSALNQLHAQFIVKRLRLVGGGNLVMVPDADAGFESSFFGGALIR